MLVLRKIHDFTGYINNCNANSKPGWLQETEPSYFNMVCSRHITNKKNLFIRKLQLNITKLECANRKIFTSGEISFVCLFYIDENRNPLTTRVDNILYSPQVCSNFILFY